jgi:hypothetical protein
MLATNMDLRNGLQREFVEESRRTTKPPAAEIGDDSNRLMIKIEDASLLALRQEEEEDLDADADFDDDEIESELEDLDHDMRTADDETLQPDRKHLETPLNDLPLSPTPRTPKRTLDEMEVDPKVELANKQNIPRVGTPPKRARIGDPQASPRQSPPPPPSPVRLRKRSSEEREDDAIVVQSNGKRVKA